MSGQDFRVFISAVSSELGAERREVARVLRRKNLTVRDQEHFRSAGGTLLDKLEAYIKDCDAVIFLIGAKSGHPATDAEAQPSPARLTYDSYRQATGTGGASYTQWEYLLAHHHGRPCYVFVSGAELKSSPECDDGQRAFRDWLVTLGKDWSPFAKMDKLVEEVLVLDLPTLARVIPDNLPFQSLDSLFKGRGAMLDELEDIFRCPPKKFVGAALHGLGGVGKTRFAVEYAHGHATDYNALLFLIADTPESLSRNLASLATVLSLPQKEAREDEVKIAATLDWFAANPGWLLILDNVDNEAAAKAASDLIGRLRGGHVLITARFSKFKPGIRKVELLELEPKAATAYLLEATEADRIKTNEDAARARNLAKELDGLAVALEQAAAYINAQHTSFAHYLDIWKKARDRVLAWHDDTLMNYPKPVAATWLATMDGLPPVSRTLLDRLAWFAPEPIPDSLVDVPAPHMAPHQIREALVDLFAYSLANREQDGAIAVHRIVQDIVRGRQMSGETRKAPCPLVDALTWVNSAFTGDTQDVRTWSVLDPLVPHVRAIAEAADRFAIVEPTARLMSHLGLLLDGKFRLAEAEPLLRRALAINEVSLGSEHPEVATSINNLAQLLQTTNRLAEAEPLMRRALSIGEASLGPKHPKIAVRLNNLASLLRATSRLAEAEPLLRRALAIDEASFGPEHPEVATDLNNLAQLLQATNRLAEAEPLLCRALTINEASFGPEHPNVAIGLSNLAVLLRATNRLEEAEPLMRRSLAITEASFGPKHPWVAIPLGNLAQLLQDTNRLAEAEPLMRRGLAIDEASFGPEHPEVATDLNNLASLLLATNRFAEAEPLMRRHLEIFLKFNRATGHEHPHWKAAVENYRILLAKMGRGEAEIEEIVQKILSGPQSPAPPKGQ